jgi:hypothetical protein
VLLLLHEPFRPCDEAQTRPLRDLMRVTQAGDLIVLPSITNCVEQTILTERYERAVDGSWRQRPAGAGDAGGGVQQPRGELFKVGLYKCCVVLYYKSFLLTRCASCPIA